MAEVLYRKWRPRSFGDLAGQAPVTRTLRNAIAQGKVAHAYLFCGPRGTGKTSTGRILAKAANCASPADGEPCDACTSCRAFLDGSAMDLIEIDAASNRGIDEIRNLRESAAFHSTGERKVYLIDEVHMLTEAAFNALLKILEEPPSHVIFILATTEVQRVPATILSRCQRFNFRRIPVSAMTERLRTICAEEQITIEQPALEEIARAATGSLRDATNLLQQAVAYHGRDLTLDHVRDALGLSGDLRVADLARAALRRDLATGLGVIAAVRDDGIDMRQFTRELVQYLRAMLLVHSGVPVDGAMSAEQIEGMRTALANINTEDIVRALRTFGQADFRADPLSSLPLELALAECALAREHRADEERRPVAPKAPQQAAAQRRAETPTRSPGTNGRPDATRRPELRPLPSAAPRDELAPGPEVAKQRRESDSSASPAERVDDDAPPELQAVRARWTEVFNLARTLDKRAGALLNSACDIIAVQEEPPRIVFGFRHRVHAERAATGDGGANLRTLTQAVHQVFGRPYLVECRHEPDVIDRQRAASAPRAPLVRAALDLGARIVGER